MFSGRPLTDAVCRAACRAASSALPKTACRFAMPHTGTPPRPRAQCYPVRAGLFSQRIREPQPDFKRASAAIRHVFEVLGDRSACALEIRLRLADALAKQPSAHWMAPCPFWRPSQYAALQTYTRSSATQKQQRGMLPDILHPLTGTLKTFGNPIRRIGSSPYRADTLPPPHTDNTPKKCCATCCPTQPRKSARCCRVGPCPGRQRLDLTIPSACDCTRGRAPNSGLFRSRQRSRLRNSPGSASTVWVSAAIPARHRLVNFTRAAAPSSEESQYDVDPRYAHACGGAPLRRVQRLRQRIHRSRPRDLRFHQRLAHSSAGYCAIERRWPTRAPPLVRLGHTWS